MRFEFIFSNKYIYIRIKNFELIIVIFYIDDIFIFIKNRNYYKRYKKKIKKNSKIKNFNLINKILDI